MSVEKPEAVAARLVPFDGSDPALVVAQRRLVERVVREERRRVATNAKVARRLGFLLATANYREGVEEAKEGDGPRLERRRRRTQELAARFIGAIEDL